MDNLKLKPTIRSSYKQSYASNKRDYIKYCKNCNNVSQDKVAQDRVSQNKNSTQNLAQTMGQTMGQTMSRTMGQSRSQSGGGCGAVDIPDGSDDIQGTCGGKSYE